MNTCQMTAGRLSAVNRERRTVDIVASAAGIDQNDNSIVQSGWKLDRFKKFPVICLQHDAEGYTATMGLPIAQAIPETVRVENDQLVMTVQFPEEGKYPISDLVFNMVSDGLLRGISVGWNPLVSKYVEEDQDGKTVSYRLHEESLLLEVSFVTVPANDKGMVKLAAKLNIDESSARHKAELLEAELEKRPHHAPEDVEKWRAYFEKKQPANRASTKCLKRFFEIKGEQQPDDEVAAWNRMDELLEEPTMLSEEEKAKIRAEVKAEIQRQPAPEEVKEEGKEEAEPVTAVETTTVPATGEPVTLESETTIEVKPEVPPEPAPVVNTEEPAVVPIKEETTLPSTPPHWRKPLRPHGKPPCASRSLPSRRYPR